MEELEDGIELAHRWGLLYIPPGKQVSLVGWFFARDRLVRGGSIIVSQAFPGESAVQIADCEFHLCTVAGSVEQIVKVIGEELNPVVLQPEPPPSRRSRVASAARVAHVTLCVGFAAVALYLALEASYEVLRHIFFG